MIKWMPPPVGIFLLNTDGACQVSSHQVSAGGLIRGSDVTWMKGFMVNIGKIDSLTAELWGLREGLRLAKSLGLPRVIVELDALVVIQLLKQGVPFSHQSATLIYYDVMDIIQESWLCEIRHILRGEPMSGFFG